LQGERGKEEQGEEEVRTKKYLYLGTIMCMLVAVSGCGTPEGGPHPGTRTATGQKPGVEQRPGTKRTVREPAAQAATQQLVELINRGVSDDDAATVRALLAGGADIEATDADGGTIIHAASVRGSVEILRLLVRHGAQVNRAVAGYTALRLAREQGHSGIVEFLRQSGAHE
jgi:hypothetical protein